MSIDPVETGYLHRDYVRAYSWGEPLHLPASGGWLLRRNIPAHPGLVDAMGAYPLFCCRNWSRLGSELASLDGQLVSTTLITDPMAEVDASLLQKHFQHVFPYRDHFVAEIGTPAADWVNSSHRRHALKALREVDVDLCPRPSEYLADWLRLYAVLAKRHDICGLRRLTPETLERQLSVPGLVMFRAAVRGRTIGLDLWYVQDDVAHGHLVAFDDAGYRLGASYATKWFLLEWFRGRVRWLNLGGGRAADGSDGLSRFKRGFANTTRPTWLCGRIGDAAAYARLTAESASLGTTYFPIYRAGELM
jgi:hypothetical protein